MTLGGHSGDEQTDGSERDKEHRTNETWMKQQVSEKGGRVRDD